jgi:zinc protease
MEIIRTAPRDRFVEYYKTWYRPSRATVIAVGDFDVSAMEKRIRKNFADWQPSAPDGVEPDVGQIVQHGQQAYVYTDPSLPPSISVTWINPPELKPDTMATRRDGWVQGLAIAVLNRRLDEMTRSENPPFATIAASASEAIRAIRVAGFQATYLPGKWREALAAIEQTQRQFAEYGVSQAELQREINSRRTAYEAATKNISTRNTMILAIGLENDVNERQVTTTPNTDLAIFEAAVKGLTAEEVSAAAKKMFVGGGPIISLMTNDPVEGGDATLASAYDASQRVAVARSEAPASKAWAYTDFGTPGKVVSTGKPDMFGAVTVTFENGVALRFKRANFNKNVVSINILTGIGDRNFSPDKFDARRTAIGGFVPGGLGKMTVDEAYRSLNGRVVGANLTTMGQRFLISGGTIPKDLDLEMQYLAAFVSDSAFRSAPFDMALSSASIGWTLAQVAPESVFSLKVRPVLGGGDKRLEMVSPEETKGWQMDPIRDDLKAMLGAGPIEIAIVGDTTLDAAVKAVASTFGTLPKRPPYNAPAPGADVRRFPAPNTSPAVFMHKGLASQAVGSVSWKTIDAVDGLRATRQMQVLKAVLQLRALDILREKEALTYSPRVADENSSDYPGYGLITISANTVPEKLPAFYAAVDGIVKSLQDMPISADELKRARQPMIEHVRKNMNTNDFWAGAVMTSFYQPALAREALNGEADYMSVTPAMIQELARKYLGVDRAYRASVVPEKTGSPSG